MIYTTPLKALSNQKLVDMRAKFGVARCGLQTGDASINANGDVVIMTTEILRNIMYSVGGAAEQGTTPVACCDCLCKALHESDHTTCWWMGTAGCAW